MTEANMTDDEIEQEFYVGYWDEATPEQKVILAYCALLEVSAKLG